MVGILADCIRSAAIHLLHAHRPEPRRSARARDRARVQDRSLAVRGYGTGVDEEVCDLGRALKGKMGGHGYGDEDQGLIKRSLGLRIQHARGRGSITGPRLAHGFYG